MELKVTHLVNEYDCAEFSASRMELGDRAGEITWNNAKREVTDNPLVTSDDDIQACKDYFGEFGAWDDEERAAWTPDEVNALLLQFIAGDIREMEAFDDYDDYQKAAERGTCSGRLYKGDDDEWYFYVGS